MENSKVSLFVGSTLIIIAVFMSLLFMMSPFFAKEISTMEEQAFESLGCDKAGIIFVNVVNGETVYIGFVSIGILVNVSITVAVIYFVLESKILLFNDLFQLYDIAS